MRYIKIAQAAQRLEVSTKTLRRWEKDGILVPKRTPGGQRVYLSSQIEAFVRPPKQSGRKKNTSSVRVVTVTTTKTFSYKPYASASIMFAVLVLVFLNFFQIQPKERVVSESNVLGANTSSNSALSFVGSLFKPATFIFDETVKVAKNALVDIVFNGLNNDVIYIAQEVVDQDGGGLKAPITGSQIAINTIFGNNLANGQITANKFVASLVFPSNYLVDLSKITHSTTSKQGLILPNTSNNSPAKPVSGEGYLAYDTNGNQLIVYNGTNWTAVGGDGNSGGDITDVTAGAGLTGGGGSGGVTLDIVGGNGFLVSGDQIDLDVTTSGTTATTSSNSGLELTSGGLSLIRGCANTQILKWNSVTELWYCAADGGGGGGSIDAQEGGSIVVSGASAFNFTASDFNVTESPSGVGLIAIDYVTSKISRTDSVETLTNKTIAAGSNTITGLTNSNLSGSAGITNANLANSSVTINSSGILTGGGSVALGGTLNLTATEADTLATVTGRGATTSDSITLSSASPLTLSNSAPVLTLGTGNSNGTLTIKDTAGSPNTLLTLTDTGSVGNLSVSGTVTGSNLSGTNTGDQTITLTGDVTGTGTGSFATTISANSVALTDDTTGNYVANVTAGNGAITIGGSAAEGWSPSVSLALQTSSDGLSSTTSNGSGLEITSGGLTLLQGCGDGEILKWNETSDTWGCSTDSGASGNSFETISAPSGTNPVADSSTDTLTLSVTGTNITITGSAAGDSLAFNIDESVLAGSGLVANSSALDIGAGNGISVAADSVAVDQTFGFTLTGNNTFSPTSTNDLSINTDADSTFVQTFSSGTNNTSSNTVSLTNSASSGTVAVNGLDFTFVGTDNAGGANTITGINFGNATAHTNNTYNGLTFGTGYTNFLTSGTINIAAGGTITGSTIAAGSNTITGLTNSNLSGSAGITNANLANSSVTINSSGILTGGGSVSLGGTLNLTATEADTLASVTGRGATTSTGITLSSASPLTLSNSAPVVTLGTGDANATLTIKDSAGSPNTLLTLTDTGTVGNLSVSGTVTGSNLSGTNTGDQTITLTGDVTGTGTGSFGTTIAANSVALTTDTTGNYVATGASGNGVSLTGGGSEGATLTAALGALTGDWDQTGAFDIALNNSSSELKILESGSTPTLFGIFDVGDLSSSDSTFTFSGSSGTVLTSANYTGTLDSVYVNVAESPSAGDIAGSFSGGLTINSNTIDDAELVDSLTYTGALSVGNLTISDTGVPLTGASFTFDFNNGSDRTLTIANSGAGTANLSVDGTISASNFSGSSSGTNTGDQTITLTGDVTGTGTGSFGTTIAANSVALTADTTGNYVATLTNGAGISGADGGAEGSTLTLAVDQSFSPTWTGNQTFTPGSTSDLTVNTDADSTLAEVFTSGVNNTSSNTVSLTNSASSGTVAVRGIDFTFTGTDNAGGANTITGINFGNATAHTNNTYNGLTFGTGYTNFLTSGTINIAAGGTITGSTIAAGSNTITGLTNSNLSGSAGITNANLANSSITINSSGILTGGGSVSLGGNITLTATEADTLASVTGRGATTSTAVTLSNASNSITAGTLTATGGTINGTVIGGSTPAAATFTSLTANGDVALGDAITDSITFTGRVAQDSDLLPITATGTNDIGSASLPFDNIYSNAVYQNGNLVCDSSGANCPAGAGYWGQALGALNPTNNTVDLLIGGNATTSAKFAFKNVLTGTPTASISGTTAFVSTFLTGEGNLATTNMSDLTLGGSSTGNVVINSRGSTALTANGSNVTVAGNISAANLSGTNTGDQTITLTGDVTGTGTGSFATTIAANSVALTADTTGNYVATLTNGVGISGADGGAEGSTLTLAVDQSFSPTWTGNQTFTPSGSNGVNINLDNDSLLAVGQAFSGSNSGNSTTLTLTNTTSTGTQNGLYLDNAASSGVTESLLVIDNSDTDTAVTNGIQFIDAGGTFTNLFNVAGTLISSSEFTVLDGGIALSELTDSGTLTAGTVDINGGAIDGTAIGATSPSTGAFTTLSATGDVTMNDASADTILIGQSGATDDTVTIAGNISLTDDQWSISATGVASGITGITADSVAFANVTAGTNTNALVIGTNGSLSTSGTGTITATDLSCTDCIGATEIGDLTLGTDTAGNFVASVATSTGLSGGAGGSEGAALTLSIDQASTLTWTGNTAFSPSGTNDLTINTDADSTLAQVFTSGTNNTSSNTISLTNSASSGTIAVKGLDFTFVGTDNAGGANTITGINFGNATAHTNNTYNGLTFGTGYNNFLTSGTINITAAGAISGATTLGLSGAITGATATNTINGAIINGSTQTFSANNIADSGALTIKSAGANALTLDSGTTGIVNLGTGTSGKTINIGTDNSNQDTLNIGSALDNVAITGDDWSVSNAGAAAFASVTEGGTSLAAKYAPIAANFITVTANGTLTGETGIDALVTAISTTSTLNVDSTSTLNTTTIDAGANLSLADGVGTYVQTFSPLGSTAAPKGLTVTPKFTLDATDQTLSAIYVNANTNSNNDSGDTLYGLNLDNITGSTAVESALRFGSGWDNVIDNNGTLITATELNVVDGGIANSELTDSGTLTAGAVDINGGTIDGTTIGGTSAAAGTFTSVTSTGAVAVNSASGITSDQAVLVLNAAGNVDVRDALNADSITSDAGVSIANGASYTGSGSVTLSSGGSGTLTLSSATGTTDISSTLRFAGPATDVTTGVNESLTLSPNGIGDLVLSVDGDTNIQANATITGTNSIDLYSSAITNQTTSGTQRGLSLSVANDSSQTQTTEQLIYLSNLETTGTLTDAIFVEQNASGGTLTNALHITNTAGTLANAIVIDGIAPSSNILSTESIDISGAGAISGVTTLGLSGAITGATATNTINGAIINGSTQTFSANNIADSGALTIKSAAGANALTLDSGTTGTVNLGTSNNAKTIAVGTGNAGNTINVGTDNTVSDTIVIGSALDNVSITGDQWSITDAGVLTVASCSGCGGGGSTLQSAYNASSGNTILTTTGRNIAFTLGEVASPTSLTLENQDTAGVTALGLTNSIASGALTNGILIDQTGAGTLTSALKIVETAGTITDGIVISGTLGNILNSDSIDITGAGAITGATGVTTTTLTSTGTSNVGSNSGAVTIDSTGTVTINDATIALSAQATDLDIKDNTTSAFTVSEGSNNYIAVSTNDGAPVVTLDTLENGGTINVGTSNFTRTTNIGTGTGADTINIGTGATTADAITFGNTGVATTFTFNSGATTQTPVTFNLDTLTQGTGIDLSLDGLTTGTGLKVDDNTGAGLTTGSLVYVNSVSTALTTPTNGGSLAYFNWNPASTTTATGDLVRINIGSNGNVANLFNVTDNGSSLFRVSESQIESAVPHTFSAAGDVSIAYDLVLTNQTSSNIKAKGPLTIDGGEIFESNDLTLKTYNAGDTVITNGTSGNIAAFSFDAIAGTSGNFFTINPALTAMNGSDTVRGLYVNVTNANHTSTSNTLNLIDVGAITGDAESSLNALNIGALTGTAATEYALNFGSGWDANINFSAAGDVNIADNTASALTITEGSSEYFGITTSNGAPVVNLNTQEAGGTINIGSANFGRTVNIGTGTGADAINIGTGATAADTLTFGNTGVASTFTFNSGATTQTPLTFNFDTLTQGTGIDLSLDGLTTGTGLKVDDNTGAGLTTGSLVYVNSVSTALTTPTNGGSLGYFNWNPASTTNATGDLFRINIGSSGNTSGNIFNVTDNGSTNFAVSENQITSALPHSFTAVGDVAIAYDLVFTNQTSSLIDSYGPLTVRSGESFESNNLTLKTYNSGKILLDTADGFGGVGVGASVTPNALFEVNGQKAGQALVILNQTGNQDVLAASVSGTTKARIDNSGDILSAGYFSGLNSNTNIRASGTGLGSTGTGSVYFQDSSGVTKGRLDTTKSGIDVGDGSDGSLTVSSGTTVLNNDSGAAYGLEAVSATAGSGQTTISVASTTNLVAGDEILVIQMQGVGAGNYEFRDITTVNTNTSVVVNEALNFSYTEDASSSAQIVEVPQFTNVTQTGGTINAAEWDGSTGGIMVFRATGTVALRDTSTNISLDAHGFRGGACSEAGTSTQGEGIGTPTQSAATTSNYTGGGGGVRAAAGLGGGGGASSAENGTSVTSSGTGGKSPQTADLKRLYLGGGGGGGGDDSDVAGCQGGAGGDGGGILYIEANEFEMGSTAYVNLTGGAATAASANDAGGGGGGSGGNAIIRAITVKLTDPSSTDPIDVDSSGGGVASGTGTAGGGGGDGSVLIEAKFVTGGVNETSSHVDHMVLNNVGNTYGTLLVGKVDTQAADLAELYTSKESLEPGDIVSITDDPNSTKFDINRSNKSSGHAPMGVVSTAPGLVLGSLDLPNDVAKYPVALKGRTPVKVTNRNGNIKRGDPIALDEGAGYGTKAKDAGYIVGYSLDSVNFDETAAPCPVDVVLNDGRNASCGTIMLFVETGWYDPQQIAESLLTPEQISEMRFASLTLDANTGEYTLPEVVGQITRKAIASTVGFFGHLKVGSLDVGEVTIGGKTIAVYTEEAVRKVLNDQTAIQQITPLQSRQDVIVKIGSDATPSASFVVNDSTGSALFAVDTLGDATVSGDLYADTVHAQNIDEIEALLAQVQADQSMLLASNSAMFSATSSATLNDLMATDLYVTNQAAIYSLSVSSTLALGSDFVIQSQDSSINTLVTPLKIQSLALAPVEIMGGLFTINTMGNVEIAGDLNVKGAVTTSEIIISGDTAGRATVLKGETEVVIKNSNIRPESLIFVTPTSSSRYTVFVKDQKDGEVTVGFGLPDDFDVTFNWWIVGTNPVQPVSTESAVPVVPTQ